MLTPIVEYNVISKLMKFTGVSTKIPTWITCKYML